MKSEAQIRERLKDLQRRNNLQRWEYHEKSALEWVLDDE